jgi:hypothetical protein
MAETRYGLGAGPTTQRINVVARVARLIFRQSVSDVAAVIPLAAV